jgi:hypothetical protein
MFDPAIIFALVRDATEMSLVSLLVAFGLMNVPRFKKLGFDFTRTTIGTCVILDLIARNGQTILSICTIALAGLLATRLWTHRRRLVFFGPLFQRARRTRQKLTTRTSHHNPSRRRPA